MLSFSQPKHLKITIFRHFKRTTGLVLYRFSSWSAYSKIPAISFSPNSKTYFRRLPPFSSTNSGWRLGSKTRDTRVLKERGKQSPATNKKFVESKITRRFWLSGQYLSYLDLTGKIEKKITTRKYVVCSIYSGGAKYRPRRSY